MQKQEVITATDVLCNYLEEMLSHKDRFIKIGTLLPIQNIINYSIEDIRPDRDYISFIVKFECRGYWPYAKSKLYFVDSETYQIINQED